MEDNRTNVDLAEEMGKEENNQADNNDKGQEQNAPFSFDYDKLAEIVNGKQTATEDSVLKGYFKRQGLSAEEMGEAINSFKEQKAKNTPDVGAIQSQAEESLQRALKAEAQTQAMLLASELSVDVKAMPYLVKMIDLTEVTSNGEVDRDTLKSKLEEVVSAMPQLKQTTVQGGFQVVGADSTKNAQSADDSELERAFGIKK